ncbi:MAG: hypothetical protein WA628_22815 [Terriglobales bacterium]
MRLAGVIAVAGVFLLAAGYLLTVGLVMILAPGTLGMRSGASLLGGLELAGPYMFLLAGVVAAVTGFGLWRLNNWARRVAIALAMLGVLLLVPSVSSAVVDFRASTLAWSGFGVMIRVMIAWYLFQEPTRKAFEHG